MNKLKQLLNDYIQTRLDLFKIELQESMSKILISIFSGIVLLICFVFGLLFITIGLANLINNLTESTFLGYFILGFIYIVLGLVFAIPNVKKIVIDKISLAISQNLNKIETKENIDIDGN